jgi:hypothetical protein
VDKGNVAVGILLAGAGLILVLIRAAREWLAGMWAK